jgi:nucleoside-diphosphate-sugar epimerase
MLTGATGFVGRHALTALTAAGHEVHAVTRRRGPELAGGPECDGVTWHEVDLLRGGEAVLGEVEPEILVHLAWYAEHGKFWSSPENLRWVESSLALLRAFVAVGGRRAVLAGTCAEYEWSRDVYPEDALQRPATLYGAAKHGLYTIASAYAEQSGLSLAWGRLFFLYGPHEAPARFVPSLIRPLLAGEPAAMTDGAQRRDFLYTADAGAAFAALADCEVAGAVNVASGAGVTLRELAERLERRIRGGGAGGGEISAGEDRVELPGELLRIGALATPEGEPPALVADVSRLREKVGWSPQIGLDEGLDRTIAWWRERLARGAGNR